jgi:hypothetical protein
MTFKEKLKTIWSYLINEEPVKEDCPKPSPELDVKVNSTYNVESPNFVCFELTDENVIVTLGARFEQDGDIGLFAKLLNSITNGGQNINIIKALQSSNCSDRQKKVLIDAWTILVNMPKMEKMKLEPIIKPSQVIKIQ